MKEPTMTLIPEAPTQARVQVRTHPAGKPLALRHEGRIWVVDPDTHSQHWFTRDSWWDTRRTAAVGSGDLVSVEYWRVQARFIYPRVGIRAMCPELGSSRNTRIIYP